MAVIKTNAAGTDMLARLIRAEAEGEGQLGMLMVGNVSVNRIRANCLDFKNIRTIRDMVFQSPGGYEAVRKPYFYQRARGKERRLARRVINGEKVHPASYSLWFYRPSTRACRSVWYNQRNVGRYKSHCFYAPSRQNCKEVYGVY